MLFIPALLLLLEFAFVSIRQTQWMDSSELQWLAPHSAVEGFFHLFFNSLSRTAYVLSVLPFLFGAHFLIRSLTRIYRRSGGSVRRAVVANPWLTLFLLCLVLYFVTPFKLYGWHYVNVRFVPYVIVFAVASFCVSGHVVRRAAVACVALASLGIYASMTISVIEARGQLEEYLSAVDNVRPNSVILPLALGTTEVGEMSPLAHAYDYYALLRGGANGKGIARFNTVTPMIYRNYPVTDRFPTWDPDRSADLRSISRVYDYVLVWGRDGYASLLLRSAAFDLIHEQGNLRLYENRRRAPAQGAATHE